MDSQNQWVVAKKSFGQVQGSWRVRDLWVLTVDVLTQTLISISCLSSAGA